jgi:hypothetical protein
VLLKLPNGDVRSVKVDADAYGTENQRSRIVSDYPLGQLLWDEWGRSQQMT